MTPLMIGLIIVIVIFTFAAGGLTLYLLLRWKFTPFDILKTMDANKLDTDKYIRAVYLSLLGREPDQTEYNRALVLVKSNVREKLRVTIVKGSDFQALYRDDNSKFVTALYRSILRRDAEPAGLAYWSGELASGAKSRFAVTNAVLESPEYESMLKDVDANIGK